MKNRIIYITVIVLVIFGWRVAYAGGNLNNGSNAGLAYFNLNNGSSNDNSNLGAQLSIEMPQSTKTMALAKKNKSLTGASRNRKLWEDNADMKRHKDLFQKVYDKENVRVAINNAKKGKSSYPDVKAINKDPEKYVEAIHFMIKNKQFKNSEYSIFRRVTGGKTRTIYKLPFYPDRIIHHCIVQVMMPIWMNLLIRDTYSTIPGRGIHDGVYRIKRALRDQDNTRFCLKMDIAKYYPTINHDILKAILSRKIKDNDLIDLFSEIIDSAPGIPIGNYISQWFGNIYLAYFDHYVKEDLKIKYYFRYADDLVLLGSNKEYLHNSRRNIQDYLEYNLALSLKDNYQVFPVKARGIDFLGYRFYHTHTLVRKRIVMAFKRKIKNKKASKKEQSAYWGWFKHANSHNLTKKYFYEKV